MTVGECGWNLSLLCGTEGWMSQLIRRLELPIVAVLFSAGSAFLLKMAYLPVLTCTILGGLFLLAVYIYMRARYGISIPVILLLLVLGAVEVDALGNYFRMYGRRFGPVMYDEFSHMAVQALIAPVIVWLLRKGIVKFGYRLPLGFVTFFAITTLFSLSAFYEVIELWDELYFRGQRIWSAHDAPNDLQWDLAGIIIGAVFAYLVLKRNATQLDAH
jgi:uncharacterized membrane protein YjdF